MDTQDWIAPTPIAVGQRRGSSIEYRYDALGRRVLVRTRRDDLCNAPINDQSEDCTGGIQRFVYAGDNVLWEMRGPGADSVSANRLEDVSATPQEYGVVGYTHAGGIDRPLLLWKGTGATPSVVVAPRVNWRGVYSGGSYLVGSATNYPIVWPGYNTNAWHRAAPQAQEPTRNWMGSLIEGQVDASGQMYMRNRMYDPATGQFTQSDPIGIGGGLNTYGFAAGDPVTYTDPYGLCPPLRMCKEIPFGDWLLTIFQPSSYAIRYHSANQVNGWLATPARERYTPGQRNAFRHVSFSCQLYRNFSEDLGKTAQALWAHEVHWREETEWQKKDEAADLQNNEIGVREARDPANDKVPFDKIGDDAIRSGEAAILEPEGA